MSLMSHWAKMPAGFGATPGVFAHLRHFALNLLRYNGQANIRATLCDNDIKLDRVLNYKDVKH